MGEREIIRLVANSWVTRCTSTNKRAEGSKKLHSILYIHTTFTKGCLGAGGYSSHYIYRASSIGYELFVIYIFAAVW